VAASVGLSGDQSQPPDRSVMSKSLGPWTAGERPPPLVYSHLTADGLAIDLTGMTGWFVYKRADDPPVTRLAPVTNGPAGEQTYTWVDADLATSGLYRAEMWVGTASGIKMASVSYVFSVRAALAVVPWP
jgi:hypothetical protein